MQAPAECSFQHALLLPAPPPALCEGELKAQSDTSDRPGMEEKETGDTTTTSEPVLDPQQCAEQTDLLSLIISGEEEATQEEIDLGHCCSAGEEEGLTNGHTEDDSHGDMVTPISSPQTSYWSVTEDPDQPLLLSAIAGPSGQKPPRVQRASRPGLSRIPGRDHRRYYHEYWRGEYLMDFDPRRHGMICMVCGSSLATLKLSTIKRHIRQKHPDSLLWSTADKEVIRSGWESHLSLRPFGSPADEPPPLTEDQLLDSAQRPVEHLDAMTPQHHPHQPPSMSPASMVGAGGEDPPQQPRKEEEEAPPAGPSAQTLERYLNDSLHAWFRQEFLMEYEAEPGRLVCMVCGAQLPSLHLDHIKSHVLDTHPNSLVYSSEEKHCILQAWAQTHEESDDFIKSESNTKDTGDAGVHLYPALNDMEAHRMNSALHPQGEEEGALTQDTGLIGEDGMTGIRPAEQPLRKLKSPRPRKRRLLGGNPWRLRLDYMVAYGPQGRGTYCMVCSQALTEAKVCTFRTHIQNCHPETITLTRQEREAMAAAWTKYYPAEGTQIKQEVTQSETTAFDAAAGEIKEQTCSPTAETPSKMVKREEGAEEDTSVSGEKGKAKEAGAATATPARHSHYPGKDQRRNYQVRWRMEFLMDYDCRRHGLICMVCGATLATLKVSTIKRHIQQVHPHSLYYGPDEKQQALQSYNQTALHFIHSDDCFSSQDHGYTAPEQTLGQLEQTLGQLEQTLGQTLGQLCAAPEEEQTPGQLYNSALVQTPEQFGT